MPPLTRKAAALSAGFAAALTLANLLPALAGQDPRGAAPGADALVLEELATVDWIERSNVAALREGVIDKMELQIGMPVSKGKPIGYLHNEMADLTVKKAKVAATSIGAREKAAAQRDLAVSVVARNIRLNARIPGSVSPEEVAKAEAELKVAEAMIVEASEKTKLDEAELNLARRAYEEHTIVAPIDGVVIERMKNPGESVRANEAVVRLGNLGKLRAYAYVPLDYAFRVKEGQIVEIQPRLAGQRNNPLPIEMKKFRGRITFVDPQIQPVAETAVRIYADFDNKDFELRPGIKAVMTIYLNTEGSAPAAPAIGARPDANGVGR